MRFLFIFIWSLPFTTISQVRTGVEMADQQQVTFTEKYINADKERLLGNYEKAFKLYSECLVLEPENDGVHYALARLYLNQKNFEAAAHHYGMATKLDPKNEWYLTQLADLQANQGNIKGADKTFKKLRALDPTNPEYIYNHASLMLYVRDTKKALKYFQAYEELAGINPDLSVTKFQYLVGEEEFGLAEKEMETAIAQFPQEARLYSYLADLYKAQGRYAKALDVFSKAMQIEPNNAYIQLSLAEYFEQNNQVDSTKKYLRKAFDNKDLDIDTKISIILSKYPTAERNPKVRSQMLDLCKAIINAHPSNPKGHSIYGDFLFLDNQLKQARDSYYKAIEYDPSKYALWNQVLVIDSELNDAESLLIDSEKALELFPSQPVIYLFNGIAHNQNNQYRNAVKSLKMGTAIVIANKPLEAQLLASLGDGYHELGKHSSSDSAYIAALKIDSNNAYVLNNFSYFLSLRKENLDLAKKLSKKAVDLSPGNASYLDTHGWVLYQLEDFTSAEKYLKQSLDNGGASSGEVLEHYGDALFKLGEKERAKDYWQQAKAVGGASNIIDQKLEQGSINE